MKAKILKVGQKMKFNLHLKITDKMNFYLFHGKKVFHRGIMEMKFFPGWNQLIKASFFQSKRVNFITIFSKILKKMNQMFIVY